MSRVKKLPEEQSMIQWHALTPEEWERIAPLIPDPQRPGRQRITNQQVVNALLYIHATKTPWKKLPEEFGSWTGVAKRVSRWKETGTYQLVCNELEKMGLMATASALPVQEEEEAPLEWWELTAEEWEAIADLFPEPQVNSSTIKDYNKRYRQIFNILLYREYTKVAWRNMPEAFGHWRTANIYYTQWRDDGSLQEAFDRLKELGAMSQSKYIQGEKVRAGETGPSYWWELTDEEWARVEPLIPPDEYLQRKTPKSNRQMLNAILCRARTDTAWRALPEKYGPWRTITNRYKKWRENGTMDRIMRELTEMGRNV